MATNNLTMHEQEELAECERTVRNGMDEAMSISQAEDLVAKTGHIKRAVARALFKIHARKWYKSTHSSFEDYLIDRFNGRLSRAHAYRWIEWVKATEKMSPIGDILNEGQSRMLQSIPEQLKEKVIDEAIKQGNTSSANLSNLTQEILASLPANEQLVIAKQIEEKNAKRGQPEPKVNKSTEQLQDEAEKHCQRLRKIAGKLIKGKELTAANRHLDAVMETIRAACAS